MIKIIKGVYGHMVNGTVKPKTTEDEPFELTPEQETRLVSRGVAVYVGESEKDGTAEDISQAEVDSYLEDMSANELRELGKEYDLTFKVGTKKAEMLKAIKAKWQQPVEEEAEDDGELLPSFDAAEAVE